MRDDNDVLITTISVPHYAVPHVFMRTMNPDENRGGSVVVNQDDVVDVGALIDYMLEHLAPLEVRLEFAPKSHGPTTVIEVWLTWPEAELYIATHRKGALAELVKDLGQRAFKVLESINTMRALE